MHCITMLYYSSSFRLSLSLFFFFSPIVRWCVYSVLIPCNKPCAVSRLVVGYLVVILNLGQVVTRVHLVSHGGAIPILY
jgi:hypothetical protein